MPPPRHKPLDDSRSEASSTVTNLKDKLNQTSTTTTAGHTTKGKRNTTNITNESSSLTKLLVNSANNAVDADIDPNLPKTDWATLPIYNLHSYRTSYRLSTPSSHTHPHADILYRSSPVALLAPSQIQARRRLRELKHQRRKSTSDKSGAGAGAGRNSNNYNGVAKGKGATGRHTTGGGNGGGSAGMTQNGSLRGHSGDNNGDPISSSNNNTIASEILGRQDSVSLALVVRKHFNAQPMNEGETVAKFAYMVRHSGSVHTRGVQVEGAAGDGAGNWMGTQGRQVRKVDGGETGFRLRFRPT